MHCTCEEFKEKNQLVIGKMSIKYIIIYFHNINYIEKLL